MNNKASLKLFGVKIISKQTFDYRIGKICKETGTTLTQNRLKHLNLAFKPENCSCRLCSAYIYQVAL